jgi:hypothetical protein
MTAPGITEAPKLTLTLPAHWARVHAERLLNDALSADTGEARVVDDAARQAALRTLIALRVLYQDAHIAFTALRLRPAARAIDLMTLAVPGRDDQLGLNWTVATSKRPELKEEVSVDGVEAISHRSIPAEPGQGYKAFGSEATLVFRIPCSDRGAIVTVVSTVDGCEDLLERDAEEITRSIHLTNVDEGPMSPTSTRVTR